MYKQYRFYQQWSQYKISFLQSEPSIITIDDISRLSIHELKLIIQQIKKYNYCIYQTDQFVSKSAINLLGGALGLDELDVHLCARDDRVTSLYNKQSHKDAFYIPYTNKPINWHTDGYYNNPEQIVYSVILHCVQPAYKGGVNGLIDQDQVFIYLMEQNPRYIQALMDPKVMTIPENRQGNVLIRPETSTAIFSVLNQRHDVLMRYSMRKRNIYFKQDALTQEALACMDECIASNQAIRFEHKLEKGQGVVGNNILHKRTAFEDKKGQERLYYRARYYNRINTN